MNFRKPEDYLREEYFALLPRIRDAAEELEAEVRYLLVPILRGKEPYERVVVKSRIKECDSAIASLQRRQEGGGFQGARPESVSLRSLNDLAGVRILAFPRYRILEIDEAIRARFSNWMADPVPAMPGTTEFLALKYHGYCSHGCQVRAEIQLMSMLVGLFWEVEHAAVYKPSLKMRGVEIALRMQQQSTDVIRSMSAFEAGFESIVNETSRPGRLVIAD